MEYRPMRIPAAAAVLLLTASGIAAQEPLQLRRGLWFEVSSGYGQQRAGCATCEDVITSGGAAGIVMLGVSVSQGASVALMSQTWSDVKESRTQVTSTQSLIAQWYPWNGSGFFLRGGIGLAQARITLSDSTGTDRYERSSGVALVTGFGWDIPLSRRFALTLSAGSHLSAVGDLELAQRLDDAIASVYQATFGITVR